jgi:hypothetical protein
MWRRYGAAQAAGSDSHSATYVLRHGCPEQDAMGVTASALVSVGCPKPIERHSKMHEHIEAHGAETVFDHDSTLVVALELSPGKTEERGQR